MSSRLGCGILALLLAMPAAAQSVGRIRRSLDKATGGATAAPPPRTSPGAAPSATATQAQIIAATAAANRRNQAAQVGVEDRVVAFLKERIEDGSADAAFDLAKRYEEGKGVPEDPKEARRLYALSAERGNEEARTWLTEHPEPEDAVKTAADGEDASKTATAEAAAPAPAAESKPATPAKESAAKPPAETSTKKP
ncbi:MAG: SEL1-like repeat protein [Verrucomicrobiae bacterium]|nr:SEL1-like repeat protein [Verrucomicrobiae bacterium]